MDKPIALNVVAGFLGSGKTSLLRSVLGNLGEERVAVLVNEFGEVGIDGAALRQGSLEVVELSGGCVCCVLRGSLATALRDIAGRIAPERLILETTGVAQPMDVLEVLQEASLGGLFRVDPVIVVVDASFLPCREFLGRFYDNQIQTADIIVLNKVDMVTGAERADALALLQTLNPFALIVETIQGAIDHRLLATTSLSTVFGRLQSGLPLPADQDADGDEPAFASLTFTEDVVLDEGRFTDLLRSLPRTILRAKGFVNFPGATAFLSYAAGHYELVPCPERDGNRLVVIGAPLEQEALLGRLRACALSPE